MVESLAVVTGAGQGFGRALSEVLEESGYTVLALSRSAMRGVRGRRRTIRWDVADAVPEEVLEALGGRPVDLLVNNAGRGASGSQLATVDVDGVVAAFDVNVLGPLRLTAVLLPALLSASRRRLLTCPRGQDRWRHRRPGCSQGLIPVTPTALKAAQNMLTVSMANEFAGRIRFWAVHPGSLRTAMGRPDAATEPGLAARQLLDRLADPDPRSPRFVSLLDDDLDW